MIPPPPAPRHRAGFKTMAIVQNTETRSRGMARYVLNAPHPARLGMGRQEVGG